MYKIRLALGSVVLLFGLVLGGATVFAATAAQEAACGGAGLTSTSGDCTGDTNTPQVDNVLSAAVNILSVIVGIAAVIVIMVGGFKYITASGDSNAISSAKSTITYALVGLMIAALAQVLVHFVLAKLIAKPTKPSSKASSGAGSSGSAVSP